MDMEKAYDRVWKDGLRLKPKKSGVTGCMYQSISQSLTNWKARVHMDGTCSCQETLTYGVSQGGVSSPTSFFVFINRTTSSETCLVKSWETIWSCGAQRNTLKLQTAASVEYLERLDKMVDCQNQPQEDHLYYPKPFNKGTEDQPAYQQSDSACWGQLHYSRKIKSASVNSFNWLYHLVWIVADVYFVFFVVAMKNYRWSHGHIFLSEEYEGICVARWKVKSTSDCLLMSEISILSVLPGTEVPPLRRSTPRCL